MMIKRIIEKPGDETEKNLQGKHETAESNALPEVQKNINAQAIAVSAHTQNQEPFSDYPKWEMKAEEIAEIAQILGEGREKTVELLVSSANEAQENIYEVKNLKFTKEERNVLGEVIEIIGDEYIEFFKKYTAEISKQMTNIWEKIQSEGLKYIQNRKQNGLSEELVALFLFIRKSEKVPGAACEGKNENLIIWAKITKKECAGYKKEGLGDFMMAGDEGQRTILKHLINGNNTKYALSTKIFSDMMEQNRIMYEIAERGVEGIETIKMLRGEGQGQSTADKFEIVFLIQQTVLLLQAIKLLEFTNLLLQKKED